MDNNYWDEDIKYGETEFRAFQTLMSNFFSKEAYNITLIAQESELYEHNEKRSRKDRQRIWDQSGTEGSPDLQRSAIDSLYKPVHEVYNVWQRRLDFKPQNETSALAELLEVSEDKLQKELAQKTLKQEERGSIQFRSTSTRI